MLIFSLLLQKSSVINILFQMQISSPTNTLLACAIIYTTLMKPDDIHTYLDDKARTLTSYLSDGQHNEAIHLLNL